MEHESFEDQEVAEYLNKHYISIKVDREERPDIDTVYMNVCQAMTGSGGWPLTILMTPKRNPFYAGTYFPKHRKYGQVGLMELLAAALEKWETDRSALRRSGEQISAGVANWKPLVSEMALEVDKKPVQSAIRQLVDSYDPNFGGFGGVPKFPAPHNLMLLLRYHLLEKDPLALEMVETTLRQMARGGIFDHIGFGFSRYSTDARWLAPHFEKMLYDNALMITALTECFQVTGDPVYKGLAEKTLLYISREMTSPEGGFYSAQDADSEGVEGKYYTFTVEEILAVLGEEDGQLFCKRYDITEQGNFEGINIPNLIGSSRDFSVSEDQTALDRLYAYRLRRTSLHKDDKILTAWNALMIAALAKASRAFGEGRYLMEAKRAFAFVSNKLTDETGLRISYRNGRVSGKGLLDDYAFLTWACLEMYESTFETEYLARAVELSEEVLRRFSDADGGFYMSPSDGEPLIFRPMELYDGAMPSGSSVFALCLNKIAALTGEERWIRESDRQAAFYLPVLSMQPWGHSFALMALMEKVYPAVELVCVVNRNSEVGGVLNYFGSRLYPNLSIVMKTPATERNLAFLAPFTGSYPFPETEPYAFYLCRNHSCSAPFYSLERLAEALAVQQ